MPSNDILFIVFLIAASAFSNYSNKLTYKGVITGCVIATSLYLGTEFTGVILLGSFFILGIIATSWKRNVKEKYNFAEANDGKRDAKQVLANGGLAAIIGLIAVAFPEPQEIFVLMIACIFSSATADTVSSELGFVYGRNCYNILTLKKDTRGENGVISIEGTLSGLAGSIFIAFIYSLTIEQFQVCSVLTIILAGTIGNIADSVLGATLERNHLIGNNAVNFLNTLIAALIGGLLA
jgi:uncharacterized protein (TIGR00297 family)